ncbi:unnamed protein product, partial [Choristocarpus tenellus]
GEWRGQGDGDNISSTQGGTSSAGKPLRGWPSSKRKDAKSSPGVDDRVAVEITDMRSRGGRAEGSTSSKSVGVRAHTKSSNTRGCSGDKELKEQSGQGPSKREVGEQEEAQQMPLAVPVSSLLAPTLSDPCYPKTSSLSVVDRWREIQRKEMVLSTPERGETKVPASSATSAAGNLPGPSSKVQEENVSSLPSTSNKGISTSAPGKGKGKGKGKLGSLLGSAGRSKASAKSVRGGGRGRLFEARAKKSAMAHLSATVRAATNPSDLESRTKAFHRLVLSAWLPSELAIAAAEGENNGRRVPVEGQGKQQGGRGKDQGENGAGRRGSGFRGKGRSENRGGGGRE